MHIHLIISFSSSSSSVFFRYPKKVQWLVARVRLRLRFLLFLVFNLILTLMRRVMLINCYGTDIQYYYYYFNYHSLYLNKRTLDCIIYTERSRSALNVELYTDWQRVVIEEEHTQTLKTEISPPQRKDSKVTWKILDQGMVVIWFGLESAYLIATTLIMHRNCKYILFLYAIN